MIKIPSNVLAFAQDKIDVYKAFADYYNHYRSINGNTVVQFDTAMSFDEKNAKMHKVMLEEISRVSGLGKMDEFKPEVYATNPNFQWASFAVINAFIDMVLPETIIDSTGIYNEIRVGGYGDSFSWNIKPRDLFVISKGSKGKRTTEVHKQFEGQVTAIPIEHDVTVAVSFYRVLAGHENLAEFVTKCLRSIETEMAKDAFSAFNTAMGNLATGATGLRVAGYTQSDLVTLGQKVTAYNQGQKCVVLGTQVALQNILPADSNYRYTLDSEYAKLGYIKNFAGLDIMVVNQIADWTSPFSLLLDDTRLYLVSPSSQKIVKTCIEGSTLAITSDVYANSNLTQTTTLKKNWVSVVATNAVAAMISLS